MSKYVIDPAHTVVGFVGRHMMFNKVRGQFTRATATIEFDPANPAASTLTAEVDLNSVNTGNNDRDNHLRSADFFDTANNPTMTFVSKKVEVTSANTGVITGDLTIKGVTKEVKLNTEYLGEAKDPWGNVKPVFNAHAKINREDWGLTWNVALEAGGWLVSKEIEIELEAELALVPEETPAPVNA